jgi:hypothetical protein
MAQTGRCDRMSCSDCVCRSRVCSGRASARGTGQAEGLYLALRIANLIEMSIAEAVDRSEINTRRGTVEMGPVKEVQPGDAKQ